MRALVSPAAAAPLWHQLAAAVAVSYHQCAQSNMLALTCSHTSPIRFQTWPSADVCIRLLCQGTKNISSSSNASNMAQLPSAKQGSNSANTSKRFKAAEIKQLRAEIFEQHIGDGRRSGRKAILKPLRGRVIADWYFTLTGPKMHLFDDPLEEERMAEVQAAQFTGTGPPKKGQGKRAGKKR